jgi:heat shock protein HslJ
VIGQPLKALLVCLLLALPVASCEATGARPRTSVDVGGTWTAIDVAGHLPDRLDAPRVQFTAGGRIQGATGCNDFSGEVRIDGDRIAIGSLEHKGIGCPAGAREIDVAFIVALRAAEQITGGRDTGRLVLTGTGGEIVFAQPAP